MRRTLALAAAVLVLGSAAVASAGHDTAQHTGNIDLIGRFDHGDTYRQGSDLAFWGDLAVLGSYDNPGGFRLVDIADPTRPKLVGQLPCPGPQNDVSIWEDLVFLSVDSPRAGPECGSGAASTTDVARGDHFEGIRIVSIADPSKPEQIATVDTDCGSHTHTLVPDPANDRVLIYVLSYPLGGQGAECNAVTHRKISVVEVPLDRPKAAKVIATPDVSPAVGCHDVTVLMAQDLAAAACISETQLWDISNPEQPEVLSHIVNPAVNIHHSTAFAWDGDTIVIGDELGGAAVSPGCFSEGHAPLGALWFYDTSDPARPALRGWFQTQDREESLICTAHNFNVVPTRADRDVLVTGWYNGGTIVIDFTDPTAPTRLGYYIPTEDGRATSWSSYWYNGEIYSNNFDEDINSLTAESRGLDVFRFTGPATNGAIRLPHLNPQTQEPLPARRAPAERTRTDVLGETARRPLPATGAGAAPAVAVVALGASAAIASRLRRRGV